VVPPPALVCSGWLIAVCADEGCTDARGARDAAAGARVRGAATACCCREGARRRVLSTETVGRGWLAGEEGAGVPTGASGAAAGLPAELPGCPEPKGGGEDSAGCDAAGNWAGVGAGCAVASEGAPRHSSAATLTTPEFLRVLRWAFNAERADIV